MRLRAPSASAAAVAWFGLGADLATAFVPPPPPLPRAAVPVVPRRAAPRCRWSPARASSRSRGASPRRLSDRTDADAGDGGGGGDLAAEFFRSVQDRNIEGVSLDEDEEDEEDEEDNAERAAYAAGAGAADDDAADDDDDDDDDDAILREYDVAASDAGSLSDDQIYKEVKDRVFASAGAFVELTKGAEDGTEEAGGGDGAYAPPADFPDPGLTAGEVVEVVLAALRHNDVPRPDYGVEVLFGYSSPDSQIKEQAEVDGLTPAQYRAFLRTFSEDGAMLFEHDYAAIDRADFSPDGTRGYFTARLRRAGARDDVAVNFILSATGANDDDCWLIDSMLIRPPKLNRRRRR